jgi:hypothetical protein
LRNQRFPSFSRVPLACLAALLLPFVVGFDLPDSTGAYVKVAAGRGAYHLSGCKRAYDSELVEGNIGMRATLNTGGEGATIWSRMQPKKTTLGVFGNFTNEELTVTDTGEADDSARIGDRHGDHGLAGGVYAGFDWTWAGVQVGVVGYSVLQKTAVVDTQGGSPLLALRLGSERLYVSAEFNNAAPLYTGGGLNQVGLGGRLGSTRLWGGVSGKPYKEAMVTLKGSRPMGPITLSAAGSLGAANPPGQVIDREYGVSVGMEARLPDFR